MASTKPFNFFADVLDPHLLRPRFEDYRHPHLYPSEASVITRDGEVVGACLRAVYYRLTQTPPSNPLRARTHWIFELGVRIEETVIRLVKETGLWVADHVKWFNPDYHLSGEVDLIIRHPQEPETLVGIECKSFYGYQATQEIMGNRQHAGFPKLDHLLQTLLYVDWFRESLAYFKIVYLDRGGLDRRDFDVTLLDEVDLNTQRLTTWPVVNGQVYPRFTLQDILYRFRQAWEYYQARELPPRDYRLYYTVEEMEERIAKGLVSKTTQEAFRRNPQALKHRKGDWRCSYCLWRNLCWQGYDFEEEEDF